MGDQYRPVSVKDVWDILLRVRHRGSLVFAKCHGDSVAFDIPNRPGREPQRSLRSMILLMVLMAVQAKHLRVGDQASARFMLLMASSISWLLLKPTVALSTPAFWNANLIAFTRSS